MRPYLEKLLPPEDASWSMLNRRLDDAIPFQWHHHPEFELTLTLNSRGQRFVGDHVGSYDDADLVLVGPNLPHTWASTGKLDEGAPHVALVFWFRREWIEALTGGVVEFRPIRALVARGQAGLRFSAGAADAVRADFRAVFDLVPAERLLGLLGILNTLARDKGAVALASGPASVAGEAESRQRIDRVLTHIHAAYVEGVALEALADIAALSVSGLHRMFRKHTRTTVSEYLIRLRIGDACARLSGTDQPVRFVADAVGYASLANFNRQFRRLRGMTPRDYRARFRGTESASG
jgi:AraC-like DNA-binding protein